MRKSTTLLILTVLLALLVSACQPAAPAAEKTTAAAAATTPSATADATTTAAPTTAAPTTAAEATTTAAVTTAAAETNAPAAVIPDEYVFVWDEAAIRPAEPAADVKAVLDRAKETGEAPSCAFEGMDKVFRYDGFEIQTGTWKGVEYVTGVILLSPDVATPEGLKIGMSLDDMLARYGDDYKEDFGQYIYEDEKVKLIMIVDADEVLTISYIGKFDA